MATRQDHAHIPDNDNPSEQARRCRRLAEAMYNRETSSMLESIAQRFEQAAADRRG
jgi:hypothetical protein